MPDTNLIESNENEFDCCVSCGEKTPYKKTDHINNRENYVEGAGQLCAKCHSEIYKLSRFR